MEGNDCYKFSTIYNFILKSGAKPISVAVDIGVNVGAVLLLMHEFFPTARIFGFEAVKEYFDMAAANTRHLPQVELFNQVVTAEHLYADDLGQQRRPHVCKMKLLKALPACGPGWGGGSKLVPLDHASAKITEVHGYDQQDCNLTPVTLEGILDLVRRKTNQGEIDLIKIDCEGCEFSLLGTATMQALERVRFIAGEYHDLARLYRIMQAKLFRTHKVNVVGGPGMGAFFAERLDGEKDGILRFDKRGMLHPRPWLSAEPIDWHVFNREFVMPHERVTHGIV